MSSLERELRETVPGPATGSPPPIDAAAAAAGLLDVAYATLDSPLGRLLVAVTPRGLVRLAYLDAGEDEDAVLVDLAARVSPRVLASARPVDTARRELDEYFERRRTEFEIPIDWRLTHGFGRRVLHATERIPYGGVSSYKLIASEAGSPRGFRAAGNALGANPIPIVVPCHRVLLTGGKLGGYGGGLERKRVLLALERQLSERS
jgi:methylated-DNA-[protein]-cysteine S-methyltransferase